MDGSNPVKIVTTVANKILDLAIDYETLSLYWIDNGNIYKSDFTGNGVTVVNVLESSSPTGISISNGTLYWTQKVNGNGSIYSYSLASNTTKSVIQMSSLHPGDISSLIPKSIIQSGKKRLLLIAGVSYMMMYM